MRFRLRQLAVPFAALIIAVLALTVPASADPGNGNAYGQENGNAGGQSAEHSQSDHVQAASATTGDLTQPQPLSNADQNGTGANVPGPYDSTRDGSPSGNGEGGGNATGQPCAGCVGNADNKNPPGQQPGPQDHNNGYECDGNKGIAKTNPAHTGCTPGDNPPPECDATVEQCEETTTPPPPGDEVLGEVITRNPTASPDMVEGEVLARTGLDASGMVTISGLMLAMGGFLIAASKRMVHA
jgi:hypothetical protein